MEQMNLLLLKLIWENRKIIILVTIIGFFTSIIISFIIKPKFKSTSVIYPTNLISTKGLIYTNELLSENEATNTEQLMQFMNSNDIKDIMLKKFKLDEHYELNKKDPKFNAYYTYIFNENFKISQTKYESVLIEVFDKDPLKAQEFGSGIIAVANELIKKTVNNQFSNKIKFHKINLDLEEKKIDSIKTILNNYGKEHQLFDYLIQIEQMSKSYYKNVSTGKTDEFNSEFKKFSEYGSEFTQLIEEYNDRITERNKLKLLIDEDQSVIDSDISYIQVISTPSLPPEKYSPKRTIIVILFSFSSFIFSCLYFIIRDKLLKIKNAIT